MHVPRMHSSLGPHGGLQLLPPSPEPPPTQLPRMQNAPGLQAGTQLLLPASTLPPP